MIPWRILLLNHPPGSFFPFPVNDTINHTLEFCRRCWSHLSELGRVCYFFPKAPLSVLENARFSFLDDAPGSLWCEVLALPISSTLSCPISEFLYALLACLVMVLAFISLIHAYWGTALVLHAFPLGWLLEVPVWGSLYLWSPVLLSVFCQGPWIQNSMWLWCYFWLMKASVHIGLCSGSGGVRVTGRQRDAPSVNAC